jgi:hypothetical protein
MLIDSVFCVDLKPPVDRRKNQNGGLTAEVEREQTTAQSKGMLPSSDTVLLRRGYLLTLSVGSESKVERLRAEQRKRRSKIVLWRSPLTTFHYFFRELLYEFHRLATG